MSKNKRKTNETIGPLQNAEGNRVIIEKAEVFNASFFFLTSVFSNRVSQQMKSAVDGRRKKTNSSLKQKNRLGIT